MLLHLGCAAWCAVGRCSGGSGRDEGVLGWWVVWVGGQTHLVCAGVAVAVDSLTVKCEEWVSTLIGRAGDG
jgi:hypothetical protein